MTEDRRVRPARPDAGLTEDGRRLRVLTSYSRRGSRLTPKQRAAWERRADHWLIPTGAVDTPGFEPAEYFGRKAPLIVEIGSGVGEATAVLAAGRPEANVLAFEVWLPGVAETFRHLEKTGAQNVRLLSVDAVWSLEHLLGPDSIDELWTFFPDPWPKKRHHRRRLISAAFADLASSRIRSGGLWRLATDWPDYAEQIAAVIPDCPGFDGGVCARWEDRPVTRFERRGVAEGREIEDFRYRRR